MLGRGKKKQPVTGRITGVRLAPGPGARPFWVRGTTPDGQNVVLRANRAEIGTLIEELQGLIEEHRQQPDHDPNT
jgi:hypothetical protein